MRAVLLVLLSIPLALLSTCGGPTRPAVIPKLSELPAEPEQRNLVLDSAHVEPGPEQQKGKTTGQKKVETAAATAAAWIGILLSDHENVTMGGQATFDENQIIAPQPEQKKPAKPEPLPTDQPLVPWVKLNEK